MPCLNEAETLGTCIAKAKKFLESNGVNGEIIIGDNGSTDGSREIAEKAGARIVAVAQRGYGSAIYHATLAAAGQYAIVGDSDNTYDFSDLLPFLEKLRVGYDLVMGNRFLGGIRPGAMPWKNRYIGTPVLTAIGRLFFHCSANDFNCGLRGYSLEAFRRMHLCTTGMEFASEMVIKATILGMRVTEVPTTLSPSGRSRPPHLRPWRDGWRHLRFMLLYSPRWLFFYPGIFFIFIGSLLGAWLLPKARTIFGISLDIQTLLFCAAAVLLGFQAVLFTALAKIFLVNSGLLPRNKWFDRIFRLLNLERGIFCGVLLLLAGLSGAVFSVFEWGRNHLGPLNPEVSMRSVIPSVLLIILGFQIVFASFFFSVLGINIRGSKVWSKAETGGREA
ncbi:MAG: glycosyltransferase family 2 protein [Candidatus Omnitrophota bacterium]|nr:glycosyltransferase family 2 protein [Candidatus Omnitrophota bacterium]